MKKIVLIEDDSDLFALLKYNLEKEGYSFAGSQTGKGALELCKRERPDLVILDIMLPDSDGLEICKAIRNHPDLANTPVIFLTARATETDRIVGLELGADDYICKPFDARELVARMRTVLRRVRRTSPAGEAPPSQRFTFGDWTLEAATRALRRGDGEREGGRRLHFRVAR